MKWKELLLLLAHTRGKLCTRFVGGTYIPFQQDVDEAAQEESHPSIEQYARQERGNWREMRVSKATN